MLTQSHCFILKYEENKWQIQGLNSSEWCSSMFEEETLLVYFQKHLWLTLSLSLMSRGWEIVSGKGGLRRCPSWMIEVATHGAFGKPQLASGFKKRTSSFGLGFKQISTLLIKCPTWNYTILFTLSHFINIRMENICEQFVPAKGRYNLTDFSLFRCEIEATLERLKRLERDLSFKEQELKEREKRLRMWEQKLTEQSNTPVSTVAYSFF